MSFRQDTPSFLAAALTAFLLAMVAGCASETGRSTVGGLVYGSMVGTTIAPGIGSAIGAGVGVLAGAFEGAQKERAERSREEVYHRTFYRQHREAEEGGVTRETGPVLGRGRQPSERFGNLLSLQDNQPLVSLLEREVNIPSSPAPSEGEATELNMARLHQELTALRRERRELEAQVGRLTVLLEEYDRSGRNSKLLLDQMGEVLGLPHRKAEVSPSRQQSTELLYLQEEYELALRLRNDPLAEAVARRFEHLSGRKP